MARNLVESELDYLGLMARYHELSDEIADTFKGRDLHRNAVLRLERAWVQMRLRDLHGPWTGAYYRWNAWMWDDVSVARKHADRLALENGEQDLLDRILVPYPRIGALMEQFR